MFVVSMLFEVYVVLFTSLATSLLLEEGARRQNFTLLALIRGPVPRALQPIVSVMSNFGVKVYFGALALTEMQAGRSTQQAQGYSGAPRHPHAWTLTVSDVAYVNSCLLYAAYILQAVFPRLFSCAG
jgi:hypothetical protein